MSSEDLRLPTELGPESKAKNFCHDIKDAAERVRHADSLLQEAYHRAALVMGQSMYGHKPFRLLVQVPSEVESYIKEGYEIIEESPESFEATEVTAINSRGVQFYDRTTDRSLNIRGHKFEVSPIFEDTKVTEGPH